MKPDGNLVDAPQPDRAAQVFFPAQIMPLIAEKQTAAMRNPVQRDIAVMTGIHQNAVRLVLARDQDLAGLANQRAVRVHLANIPVVDHQRIMGRRCAQGIFPRLVCRMRSAIDKNALAPVAELKG